MPIEMGKSMRYPIRCDRCAAAVVYTFTIDHNMRRRTFEFMMPHDRNDHYCNVHFWSFGSYVVNLTAECIFFLSQAMSLLTYISLFVRFFFWSLKDTVFSAKINMSCSTKKILRRQAI